MEHGGRGAVRAVFMELKDKTQSRLGYEVRFEVLPAFQVTAASAKALRWQHVAMKVGLTGAQ